MKWETYTEIPGYWGTVSYYPRGVHSDMGSCRAVPYHPRGEHREMGS
jgi:hypothetical protein